MKTFKQFNEQTKCPLGMKWDKKSKTCVPIISKSKVGGRWWGVGYYHNRTTNGNGNGNGNGSHNGNGSGNGNGGSGHSSGGNGGGGNGGGGAS